MASQDVAHVPYLASVHAARCVPVKELIGFILRPSAYTDFHSKSATTGRWSPGPVWGAGWFERFTMRFPFSWRAATRYLFRTGRLCLLGASSGLQARYPEGQSCRIWVSMGGACRQDPVEILQGPPTSPDTIAISGMSGFRDEAISRRFARSIPPRSKRFAEPFANRFQGQPHIFLRR